MATLTDRANEYRRRAVHLREAAETMKDVRRRLIALDLARDWIWLADRLDASANHISRTAAVGGAETSSPSEQDSDAAKVPQ